MMIVPRNNRFGFDLFDDFFKDSFFQPVDMPAMRTDIKEVDNQYVLTMDLPGFAKEDIKISHENGYLTISAQRNESSSKTDEQGRLIRQERSFGSCKRSFYIGNAVDHSLIKASHNNGVLELRFPKQSKEDKDFRNYISID